MKTEITSGVITMYIKGQISCMKICSPVNELGINSHLQLLIGWQMKVLDAHFWDEIYHFPISQQMTTFFFWPSDCKVLPDCKLTRMFARPSCEIAWSMHGVLAFVLQHT